jgi:hypothetical protein
MKTLIPTIIVFILLQTDVYCQLKNYNNKGKVRILCDKTTISINDTKDKNYNLTETQNATHGVENMAQLATILPPIIDFAVKTTKEIYEKNVLAYKGEFKSSVSGDNFYDSSGLAFLPRLTLKRYIKKKNKSDLEAVNIDLIPELSADKTAFRYYIKDIFIYNYSIAKTFGKYDYLDVYIELKFKCLYIYKDKYELTDLRNTSIKIPMVYVGQTKSLDEPVYSNWIPLLPKSKGNSGLYEIEISVTETNPFKIKAENNQKMIKNLSDPFADLLKKVIKEIMKEE